MSDERCPECQCWNDDHRRPPENFMETDDPVLLGYLMTGARIPTCIDCGDCYAEPWAVTA